MRLLVAISIFVCAWKSYSQVPQAELKLDFDKVRIGEQFKASLSITYFDPDQKLLVGWPKFDQDLSKDIEIIDRNIDYTIPVDSAGNYAHIQDFTITSFEPAYHIIPSIGIELGDSVYQTTPTPLLVESVQIDTSKSIVDIKENYTVNYTLGEKLEDWFRSYWKWLLGIAMIITAYLLYKLYRGRFQRKEITPYVPPTPAHITALTSLKELEAKEAWKSLQQKDYYSDLTFTVRLYLEQRFGIKAVEQTTREIIQELKYADISEEDKMHLRKLLSEADMIKFAKMKADSETGKIALYKSIDFVEKTKKQEGIKRTEE